MACFNPLKFLMPKRKDIEISKPQPTALPLIPPDFDDDETNTTEKVSKMLSKAEELLLAHKYKEYVELLEQIVQMGSAKAAAKLGVVHHTGLKFHMNRERDREIWDSGVSAMEHIHQILQDPLCTKFLTHQDIQKRRAVRVHITYVLGLTAEADKDFSQALEYFTMCKRFGESGFATADKLVKKAQSKIKHLEPRVPRVKPICVECGREPENKNELWGYLVCPKCLSAACCSSQCLQNHRSSKHEK
ncbi:20671_t:CDS:2 [Gigaspora margarita]|uniref:20671_t:CDS:1 n=1 Tax=Gigaspora margarita TaxID=4874 RepID=A0ABN7VJW7_GIGMA|nr:20671_t:CDS:2 [Gigaspora margarita]